MTRMLDDTTTDRPEARSPIAAALGLLAFLVLIALLLFCHPSYSFAGSHCHPLLLMVEGGGPSSDGESMENLTTSIVEEYNSRGVTVVLIDNYSFWTDVYHYFIPEAVDEAAEKISASRFSPVVIVGHSLGASSAISLASRVNPKLLVTFDGVDYLGYQENLRHPNPGSTVWRNVRVNSRGFNIFDYSTWWPTWGFQANPDVHYSIGDYGHSDVEKMWDYEHPRFGSTESAVNRALACPRRRHSQTFPPVVPPRPGELCDVEGIGCSVYWKIENECDNDIHMRFFEYDISWNQVARWPDRSRHYVIPSGSLLGPKHLSCYGPGNYICYGGRDPSNDRPLGAGLGGTENCRGCCRACRYDQTPNQRNTRDDTLECLIRGV